MQKAQNIAIFASGGGSNAQAILQHFEGLNIANITLIVADNTNAGVLKRAADHQIESFVHSNKDTEDGTLLEILKEKEIDFIVLAGYLKKIKEDIVFHFPNRIVNIHPALLPKFGGKGMYGIRVHNAVVEAGETESGPTIHYVNKNYDEGNIIAQFKCPVLESDNAADVQRRVLALEHKYYPKIIEQLILDL